MNSYNETVSVKPARDYWFDNIKGLLMIAVVTGHLTAQIIKYSNMMTTLYYILNCFHMGAFLILTGYLSKRRINEKDYVSVICKNIIPYLSAQILMYLTSVLFKNGLKAANATYLDRSHFTFSLPIFQLWYLASIILYAFFCIKAQPKRKPLLFMSTAIAASLLCGYFQQINVFRISKAIGFFPFFLLGYFLTPEFMEKVKKKWYSVVLALCVWCGYLFFMSNREWTKGLKSLFGLATRYQDFPAVYGNLSPVLVRLLFLLLVPVVAIAFYALCPRKKTIFTKLGQNSMYIFVLHGIITVWARCLEYRFHYLKYINTWYLKLAFILVAVLITFILGSNRVKKIFKPVLEPDFQKLIRKFVS